MVFRTLLKMPPLFTNLDNGLLRLPGLGDIGAGKSLKKSTFLIVCATMLLIDGISDLLPTGNHFSSSG